MLVLARYLSVANPIGGIPVGLAHIPNEWTLGRHDWPILESRIPLAVITSWLALLLSGRWRAEPSWLDRAGRVFGCYWVGLWLFRWYLVLLS